MHNVHLLVLVLYIISTTLVRGQADIEKLPASVNTAKYDETSPVLSKDGRRLFFTRTADPDFESTIPNDHGEWIAGIKDEAYRAQLSAIYSQISGKKVSNPYASILNQDIWYISIEDDAFNDLQHPGHPVNNALPNSLVSTGMLNDEFVLLNEFYKDGSMYAGFSRVRISEDGLQTFPEPMYIYGFDLINSDVNLTMSPRGHVLIMSMKAPGSVGENDLFVSFYMRENVWSTPVHMGAVLNTPYQETTPYVTPDKRYIYFSSNRPGGVGGNDIYRSERLDYTWLKWSPPQLVENVNSIYDDSQPYFDPTAHYMYFTSKRDGSSDIFRQRLFPRQQLSQPIVIRGKIVDSETGLMTRAEVFWGQQSAADYLEYFNSYNGEFIVTLTEAEPYKFQLRKAGLREQQVLIDPRIIDKQGRDTVDMVFYLHPKGLSYRDESVIKGGSYSKTGSAGAAVKTGASSFYDIFFVKSQDIILQKSDEALLDITSKLRANPNMQIQIIGHTDNVGDETALLHLSVRRAEAVKNYLVKQGIDERRILTGGAGAANPMYENDTEDNRQKNRRVEIKVIKE